MSTPTRTHPSWEDPTMDTTPPPDRSVKVAHLVLGLLLVGAAATWALLATGAVDADTLPYLGPALLVAAGVAGLAVSAATSRRSSRRPTPGATPRLTDRAGSDQATDQASVRMEDRPAPSSTRRLERQEPHDAPGSTTDPSPDPTTDPTTDGEPTAPLHRPEDLR